MTKQNNALRLAELLTADEWPGHMTLVSYARECVAELRRQHAELETLRTGYAAARLEIESLKAQGAQPAGAQQPGAAYAALTAAQESLGVEFEKVLHDNLFDLYEESAPHGQAPAQPAPQQEAQEPVAWYVTGGSRLLDEDEAKAEARRIGGTAKALPLYTVPQPSPQADSQPAPQGETNAHLDTDSNSSAPGQQRDVAGTVALGQSVGHGSDSTAGDPSAQGDKLLTVAERNIRSFLRSATFKSESDREAALNCVDVLWAAARTQADSVTASAATCPTCEAPCTTRKVKEH